MSSNDAIQVDKFHRACTEMYNFRVPTMKLTTDFKAAFKNSTNSEESINLIEKLTLTRHDLHVSLISDSTPESKLAAVDNYLPNILLLMNTLHSQDKITFDRTLTFEWKGTLHTDELYYKSAYITYEVLMVLHTKAILHSNTARHLVDSDPLNFVTDAGKHLLTAASIMQYLHDQLTGPWNGQFSPKTANPNDLNPKVCLALSLMFKANAQAMAVVKALNNESTPSLIKARLAISVINTTKKAGDILSSAVYQGTIVYNFILCSIALKRELYSAISLLFLAQSCSEKTEMGMAQAYISAAQRRLQVQNSPQYKPSDFGIPKSHGPNTVCAIAVLRGKLEVLLKHADSENRFIYFQVIPTMLPELPLEASVMNPPVYAPPTYEGPPIAFEYKAPPSMVSSIFSSFMGSGAKSEKPAAATPTASAAVDASAAVVVPAGLQDEQPVHGSLAPPVHSYAQMKEDEEYARTLQQQYSSEETNATTATASAHRGPPAANYQVPPGGFQPPPAATTYQQYHQAPPAAQQQQHYGSAPSAPSSPPAQSYQYNQPAPQQYQYQQPQQQQQQYQQQQPYGSAPPQQYQQQQQAPYNPYGSAPNSNVVSYPTL